MIERLVALDGVSAVCSFRDDGALMEGHGSLSKRDMEGVVRFAHAYERMLQGNVDQFSLISGVGNWTPPRGWVVRGDGMTLCGMGNVVCAVENKQVSINRVLRQLEEVSRL